MTTEEADHRAGSDTATQPIELVLTITDPELCRELAEREEGLARREFAIAAMKIGVLAIRQAQGSIDAQQLRNEGERLLENLGLRLAQNQEQIMQQVVGSLREYFDPTNGRFNERIERLIRKDGDLEQVLRRQIGVEESELARTLASHIGSQSPLMRRLDPQASNGLIAELAGHVQKIVHEQREALLREFSLDNKEGALARMVGELAERHGQVGADLKKTIGEVVGEFSLDKEDSALSRLVRKVERTQQQISGEFSLDAEDSALGRMRRELLGVLDKQRETSEQFHRTVIETLSAMTARKEEAGRSTRHGLAFESAVVEHLVRRCQQKGDVAEHTGNTTGEIKHSKVGDAVIELGPEHAAAGARIVVEAKEQAGVALPAALAEIETARKNRRAEVGLFVYSARVAPAGSEPLARYGSDVVVVWDAEEPASDVMLHAGLEIARALCARKKLERGEQQADFAAIDRSILAIEKQIQGFEELRTLTGTIRSNSDKILKRAEIMQQELQTAVALLADKVAELRALLGG